MLKKYLFLFVGIIIALQNIGCVTYNFTRVGVVYEIPSRINKAIVTTNNELILDTEFIYKKRAIDGSWITFGNSQKIVILHERAFLQLLERSDSTSRNASRSLSMPIYNHHESRTIPQGFYQDVSSEQIGIYFNSVNTEQNLQKTTTLFSQEFKIDSAGKQYNIVFYKPDYNPGIYHKFFPVEKRARRNKWSYPIFLLTPLTLVADTALFAGYVVIGGATEMSFEVE